MSFALFGRQNRIDVYPKNTKNRENAKNYALQHAFYMSKNIKNGIKITKNMLYNIYFGWCVKNYIFDYQQKVKNM